VLLAYLPVETVHCLLNEYGWRPYTPNTITDPRRFAEELRQIRSQGYAFDQEEFNTGLRCVAAPLFNYTGAVVAAVSISGPSSRMTEARNAELVQVLTGQTRQMSHALGFKEGMAA
jgi:DNA-binding IclR family transcriptional regulator